MTDDDLKTRRARLREARDELERVGDRDAPHETDAYLAANSRVADLEKTVPWWAPERWA